MYCGQTVGWIKMKLGMRVGLGPGHNVLDGDPSSPPQRGTAPNFRPISVRAKWLNDSRCHLVGRYRPRPKGHSVRWRPMSPSPKRRQSPKFSVHVCCGQAAGWIKMPLGTEVGLGPGQIVLGGDPAPSPKRGTAPLFRP